MSSVQVWRLEEFQNGKYDIWPFEAEYIELYRNTSRDIFFDRKWKELHENTDRGTEHDNVLRLGHLIAFDDAGQANGSKRQFELAKKRFMETRLPDVDSDTLSEKEKEQAWRFFLKRERKDIRTKKPQGEFTHGVHFWLDKGKLGNYGSGLQTVKLVAHVPVDGNLWIKGGDGREASSPSAHNTSELKQFFTKEYLRSGGEIQAVYEQNLSLEFVKQVKDKKVDSDWVEFSQYLDALREKFIFDMEGVVSEIKMKDEMEQHVNFLNNLIDELRKLDYYLAKVESVIENIIQYGIMQSNKSKSYRSQRTIFESRKKQEKYLGEVIAGFHDICCILQGKTDQLKNDTIQLKGSGYNSIRNQLIEDLNREMSLIEERYDYLREGFDEEHLTRVKQIENIKQLLNELSTVRSNIKDIISEIKEIAQEEKSHDPSKYPEELHKEEVFEEKVVTRIADQIVKIPDLRPLRNYLMDQKIPQIKIYRENANDYWGSELPDDFLNGEVKKRIEN